MVNPIRAPVADGRSLWTLPTDVYVGQALLHYGEYAEAELALLRPLAADGHVVVCGGHLGAIALPLALTARSLIVCEPQPFLFGLLVANLVEWGVWPRCHALNAALGDGTPIHFPAMDYRRPNNFGGIGAQPDAEPNTPTVRLDDLLDGQPVTLLHADVEGMELAVLRGAEQLITAQRPALYLEADRPAVTRDLLAWLHAHGYRVWSHTPPLYNPDNVRRAPCRDLEHGVCAHNWLALPADHPAIPAIADHLPPVEAA